LDEDIDQTGAIVSGIPRRPASDERDPSSTQIGAGLFWTKPLQSNITMLLGLRLNYLESESSIHQVASSTTSVNANSETDGFEWAPTLALEYALTDKVKIAAEVNYFYQDVEGKARTTQTGSILGTISSTEDLDATVNGTNTRLVLRYFF